MENYIYIPHIQEVPEWKQCYYDKQVLQKMLNFIQRCIKVKAQIKGIQIKNKQNDQFSLKLSSIASPLRKSVKKNISQSNIMLVQERRQQQRRYNISETAMQCDQELSKILSQWMCLFMMYSDHQTQLCYMFAQLKIFQIQDKVVIYEELLNNTRNSITARKNIIVLFQNLYTQSHYLHKAISYNIYQQKYIFNKLNTIMSRYDQSEYEWSLEQKSRLKSLKNKNRQILDQIKLNCTQYHHQLGQSSVRQLKQTNSSNQKQSTELDTQGFKIIGVIMGAICMLTGILIISIQSTGQTIDNNVIFRQHFPVWRGGSYLILYLWILGISILFYQKAQINYNLIFRFQEHQMPSSRSLFLKAAIFTVIYLALFVLFVMEIDGHFKSDFKFYGELFWALIFFYVFVPIPFANNKGRILFLRLLLKVIVSPCGQLTFLIVWITQQLISFNQPMGDFFYTICYTSRKQASWCLKNASYFSSAYVMETYEHLEHLQQQVENVTPCLVHFLVQQEEYQHIKNCAQFQATVKDDDVLKQVRSQNEKIVQQKKVKQFVLDFSMIHLNIGNTQSKPTTPIEKQLQFNEILRSKRKQEQMKAFKSKLIDRQELKEENKKIYFQMQQRLNIIQRKLNKH